MRVVLIGAGNLATSLGPALRSAGHEVLCVYSRTLAAARQLTALTGGMATDDTSMLPPDADLYIMAVKDSVLPQLIPVVTKGRGGQLFVHTAGSMPMSLFAGSAAHYGVLYPMQTFSKQRCVSFADIPTFLEASDQASLDMLRKVAESITSRVYELDSDRRKYLHLAAVFACNFTNHCYALSADVLEQQGIPFDVMLPLIDETARKVHAMPPRDAQTGPAVRYDENVITMQSALLADDRLKEIYELFSRSIHDVTLKTHNSKLNT